MTSDALKTTLADRAAVLEGVPDHPALKAFLAWNPKALLDAKLDRGELTLTVAREIIAAGGGHCTSCRLQLPRRFDRC